MKKITFSLLLALSVVMFSCKDDEGTDPKPSTPTHPLNGTSWTLSALSVNPPIDFFGVLISDFYAMMEDCEKDNLMNFKADGTYTITEGQTKCDDGDPDIAEQGTWELSADKKTMIFDGDTAQVQTLNSTDFILFQSFYDEIEEETYTYTMKYKKK